MAMTATIALGSATLLVDKKTKATLTISNSGSSVVNVTGVSPYAVYTGAASNDTPPVTLGAVPTGPGSTVAVPASGSITMSFDVIPFEPSTGPIGAGSGTYGIGARITSSDGSNFIPTVATLTCNPLPAAGVVSLANTTVTVAAATVASGSTDAITLTAIDGNKNPLPLGGLIVVFSSAGDGTGTGTFSDVTDNGDGTYSGTYTGTLIGTANTLVATISGGAVTSTMPTIEVTPGAVSLSQSVVTRASATCVSGATDLCTLTAKDAAGNQLAAGGFTILFSTTGGTSTGTFGSVTDVGDGTYTANFTGVLVGTATSIASTIGGSAVTSAKPTIAVTVGAASKAVYAIEPVSAVSAVAISPSFTVTITDAAGNLTASTADVVLTIGNNPSAGGAGVMSGTTTRAAVAGTATFDDISIDLKGTGYTLVATPTSLTADTSAAFNITPAAYDLAVSTISRASATVVSGATDAITITAKDSQGNQLSAGGLTVTAVNAGGASTLTYGSTTDNGDGTYTIQATGVVSGAATTVTGKIAGSSITSSTPTIEVTVGAISTVTSLVTVASPTVATTATDVITLTAKDAAGNLLAAGGSTVLFSYVYAIGKSTGTIGATTDVGDGTYTATFTGGAIGTPTTITSTIGGTAVSSSLPTIEVTA